MRNGIHTYIHAYTHISTTVQHYAQSPMKSLDFEGFDSYRLLILRGGILMSVEFDRGSPGKLDSRTLSRTTLSRWTGRNTDIHSNNSMNYKHC